MRPMTLAAIPLWSNCLDNSMLMMRVLFTWKMSDVEADHPVPEWA